MTGESENNQNELGNLVAEAMAIDAEAAGPGDPQPDQAQGAGPIPEQAGTIPEPAGPDTSELLTMLLSPAAAVLVPGWNLQPEEIKALADCWAPVLDKYFPGMQLGVEANAALVTLMIIGPRLMKPRKAEQTSTAEKKEKTTEDYLDAFDQAA